MNRLKKTLLVHGVICVDWAAYCSEVRDFRRARARVRRADDGPGVFSYAEWVKYIIDMVPPKGRLESEAVY